MLAKLLYKLYIVGALNEKYAFHVTQTLARVKGCQHFANHSHVNINFYSPPGPCASSTDIPSSSALGTAISIF